MGKRSTNTTKSGKFMNPTDQARKMARKRELKKNKKQRLLVRTSVIKNKDPIQIISDLERLDEMEYNVHNPPTLSQKVLADKRRKLMETWNRMCRLYAKDDKDRLKDIKKLENEYEAKRSKMQKYFDAVKLAQEVSLDDIPLPSLLPGQSDSACINELSFHPADMRPVSILTRKTPLGHLTNTDRIPPGVPPGLPPHWSEPEEDEEDSEDEGKRVKFGPVTDKEAAVDEFLKEFDIGTESSRKEKKDSEPPSHLARASNDEPPAHPQLPNLMPPNGPPPSQFHHPHLRPPPRMPMGHGRLPPPPHPLPPGLPMLPPHIHPGTCIPPPSDQRMMMPNAMLRPGSGPGSGLGPHPSGHERHPYKPRDPSSSIGGPNARNPTNKRVTMIEAKPQLRNLSADSTKFIPTTLRIRRNEHTQERRLIKPGTRGTDFGLTNSSHPASSISSSISNSSSAISTGECITRPQSLQPPAGKGKSRDDAYEQFMKEMQGMI